MHRFITIAIPFNEEDGRTVRVRHALAPFGNLHRDPRAVGAPPIWGFPDSFDGIRAKALRDRLDATGLIHFMSLNILPGNRPMKPHLILEVSADGAAEPVLDMLAAILSKDLQELWDAMGIAAHKDSVRRVFAERQHAIGPGWGEVAGLPFTGSPGMRVTRINAEHELARHIFDLLQLARRDLDSPLETLENVRAELWKGTHKWAFFPEPVAWLGWAPSGGLLKTIASTFSRLLWPVLAIAGAIILALVVRSVLAIDRWTWWSFLGVVGSFVVSVIVTMVILALIGLGAYGWFRRGEKRDLSEDKVPDRATVNAIMRQENHAAQNHLFAVSTMKSGWLRRFTLRLAFMAIARKAAYGFRPGTLGDLGTIHFARWILVPGTDKLVFLSNYGGSWESYLEDFIEKAHYGLTGVWSNTRNFPKTKNLFQEGATDGDRFKRWARGEQDPTLLWYSAYPTLTTSRIRLNALIRQGIACATTEADAADWLSCFGSAARPAEALDAPDVPTLVFGGLSPLPAGAAMIVSLEAREAREWLREIELRLTYGDRLPARAVGALLVAFAAGGLSKLGLQQEEIATFPIAFQDGMHHELRARSLGDVGDNEPARWAWGGDPKTDAILLVYATDEPGLAAALMQCREELARFGHTELQTIRFTTLPQPVEDAEDAAKREQAAAKAAPHTAAAMEAEAVKPKKRRRPRPRDVFNFVDGISQPIIKGTRRWASVRDRHHMVAPGEIVLGYPDNRGYLPPSPNVATADDPNNILPPLGADPSRERPDFSRPQPTERRDLGRSGTFLVVRQLEQDKPAFDHFLQETADRLRGDPRAPPDDERRREWIAAKLVGRWSNGTSLVRYPHAPGTKDGEAAQPDNDFLYGAEDRDGLRCPFGAHVRRANPRDSLSPGSEEQIKISNRHRILRVGRAYNAQGDFRKPGLFFMCLNADVERQFEFVQQTWTQSASFHGLDDEIDCFSSRGMPERFTIPTPSGPLCLRRLSDFVRVRGGGYFFMPGRRAIHYLAAAPRKSTVRTAP